MSLPFSPKSKKKSVAFGGRQLSPLSQDGSASNFAECPLCGKFFPKFRIDEHVETCLGVSLSSPSSSPSPSSPSPSSPSPSPSPPPSSSPSPSSPSPSPSPSASPSPFPSSPSPPSPSLPSPFFPSPLQQELKERNEKKRKREPNQESTSAPPMEKKKKKRDRRPLAEQLRPTSLSEFVGQQQILEGSTVLKQMMAGHLLCSLILWGPPGTGKTTLARIIASVTECSFVSCSAVTSKASDIRNHIATAQAKKKMTGKETILFIDEIHRFNKMQQDVLLPPVEKGVIFLLGATTENPSFECNSALLSRSHVVVLQKLEKDDIVKLLIRGAQRLEKNLEMSVKIDQPALAHIASVADGDARAALNTLESLVFMHLSSPSSFPSRSSPGLVHVTTESALQSLNRSSFLYDKDGDQHYNTISALHKSMRGGDDNASIYWVARMLQGGEKPEYIARRILRFASEDIGLADPHALTLGVACFQACHMLGMPECATALAQAAVYMARAPKSIEVYAGYNLAAEAVKKKPNAPVPLHICNAPTPLMEQLGYHKGYKYTPGCVAKGEDSTQDYLPECLKGSVFLTPPPSSSSNCSSSSSSSSCSEK